LNSPNVLEHVANDPRTAAVAVEPLSVAKAARVVDFMAQNLFVA
jgi:hypothetical protein